VHSHGWDADIVAFLATLHRRESRVVHLHVTPDWIVSSEPQHRVRRLMSNLMFSGSRLKVLTVASAVRDHWAQSFPNLANQADVVHNSVDVSVFRPAPHRSREQGSTLTLGVACRLSPQKGLRGLLRALPDVIQKSPTPVVLKVAGDGPDRPELERLTRELGLRRHVEFLGHISDVSAFYRLLDVFALPAVSDEGLPLAVLEAMASGLPIVATDVGGTREAVRDGVDGFVVPPGVPEALAVALSTLAEQPNRAQEMGQSALTRVRSTFSPRSQVNAVAKSYSSLVRRMPKPSRIHPPLQ
jgi:glycosyltransferase involved in cell wall biosynthesis